MYYVQCPRTSVMINTNFAKQSWQNVDNQKSEGFYDNGQKLTKLAHRIFLTDTQHIMIQTHNYLQHIHKWVSPLKNNNNSNNNNNKKPQQQQKQQFETFKSTSNCNKLAQGFLADIF